MREHEIEHEIYRGMEETGKDTAIQVERVKKKEKWKSSERNFTKGYNQTVIQFIM